MRKEILAEKNCKDILNELINNKEKESIEKIKNNEVNHQKIIEELLKMT